MRLTNYKHGHARIGATTPTYRSWCWMMDRCNNAKRECFKYYGGRGISVCERWYIYLNFLEDMGERPPKMTIDRINPNMGYEPGNCRWAPKSGQGKNRRNNVIIELNGKSLHLAEWCRELGLPERRTYHRYKRGCPPELILKRDSLINKKGK